MWRESKKTSYSGHIPYCCAFVPVSVDSDLLNVSTIISQGKIKAEHMLCYSAIGMLLLLQIDGAQHFDPPGFLTHSHTAMESAHHCDQNATVSFHGLAERQPLKQENHTCSMECSSLSELIWRFPSKLQPWRARERPSRKYWRWNIITGPVIWSLSCLALAAVTWITSPLRNDQYAALATRHSKIWLLFSVRSKLM